MCQASSTHPHLTSAGFSFETLIHTFIQITIFLQKTVKKQKKALLIQEKGRTSMSPVNGAEREDRQRENDRIKDYLPDRVKKSLWLLIKQADLSDEESLWRRLYFVPSE
ncbi:hypothetical protein ECZC10_54480 [Escherichia coli]|nr:hypothetical protein ECZC10_54480 [Escherichia coli]